VPAVAAGQALHAGRGARQQTRIHPRSPAAAGALLLLLFLRRTSLWRHNVCVLSPASCADAAAGCRTQL
jgi:hypothetical protein